MNWLDYAVSAVGFGIGDSWNPYMLAVALCFLTFLAFIGDTPGKIKLAGRSLVAVVFSGTFALSWGANVGWLNVPVIEVIIRFFALAVAATLIVTGYLLFRHSPRRWLPRFLEENPGIDGSQKNIGILFFSAILGLVALALLSLWPQDRNIYPILYTLFLGGNALSATLFFAIYGLAFVLPLFAVYRIVLQVQRSGRWRQRLRNAISWLDISFSAFFIAAGMGLIYLFTIS